RLPTLHSSETISARRTANAIRMGTMRGPRVARDGLGQGSQIMRFRLRSDGAFCNAYLPSRMKRKKGTCLCWLLVALSEVRRPGGHDSHPIAGAVMQVYRQGLRQRG